MFSKSKNKRNAVVALVALMLQNCALALVMRYSRTLPGPLYRLSTAVFLAEGIKLIASVGLYRITHNSVPFTFTSLAREAFGPQAQATKLAVPAALYALQNWLSYAAISRLDAVTYQVTAQLKILTTAIFSVLLLQRSISTRQWLAVILLTVGVIFTQLDGVRSRTDGISSPEDGKDRAVGFASMLIACTISGFGGVYFERILKAQNSDIWIRNIQLAFFGMIFTGVIGIGIVDGAEVRQNGFWTGYGRPSAIFSLLLNALGGLLVALVVKSADTVVKAFATSASIILSGVISKFVFGLETGVAFAFGTLLVMVASYAYASSASLTSNIKLPFAGLDKIYPGVPSSGTQKLLLSFCFGVIAYDATLRMCQTIRDVSSIQHSPPAENYWYAHDARRVILRAEQEERFVERPVLPANHYQAPQDTFPWDGASPVTLPAKNMSDNSKKWVDAAKPYHALPRLAWVISITPDWVSKYSSSLSSIQCYGARFGIAIHIETMVFMDDRHFFQARHRGMQKYLPHYQWVLHTDADVMMADDTIDLRDFLDDNRDVILQDRDNGEVVAGAYFVRNSARGRSFVDQWLSYSDNMRNECNWDNGDILELVLNATGLTAACPRTDTMSYVRCFRTAIDPVRSQSVLPYWTPDPEERLIIYKAFAGFFRLMEGAYEMSWPYHPWTHFFPGDVIASGKSLGEAYLLPSNLHCGEPSGLLSPRVSLYDGRHAMAAINQTHWVGCLDKRGNNICKKIRDSEASS